jgi:hypothetical protein
MLSADQFIEKVFAAGVIPMPAVATYGQKVSPHLTVGTDFLWSPDTNEITFLPQLIQLFEEARTNVWGKPIKVDAGYRTKAHEDALTAQGLQTAAFVSPHSLGSALDLKVIPGTLDGTPSQANVAFRQAFRKAAKNLDMPQPRIGHRAYGEHFIHVDLMFMLFAPFTKLGHPRDWPDLQPELREVYTTTISPGWEW